MTGTVPNLIPAMPEIILALGAMALLMLGVFQKGNAFRQVALCAMTLMIAVAAVLISVVGGETQVTFNNMFVTDSFAIYIKLLILLGSIVAIMLSMKFMQVHQLDRFEYPVLIVIATLGMFMMVSANSLLSLYLGLELQSLSLYVLAAFARDRNRSTESGLKYFVLGAISSGMLLYGISLVYGYAGSVDFAAVSAAVTVDTAGDNLGIVIGLVFILAGLGFKVSAVPFHMWTPDVYEGAPTPVTAFFAAAPKVAALALFARVMLDAFPAMADQWQQVVIFMSVGSMIVGAFVAFMQTNIKRLMAYSSIGHVGYALMAIAAGTQQGVEALLIYVTFYLIMTVGVFGAILSMRRSEGMVEDIDDLSGLSQTNLPMAIAIAIFMFSLAGIPTLAGFFGKYYVFLATIDAGLYALATIGVLASVVSAVYYLRIIKVMFFDEPVAPMEEQHCKMVGGVVGISAVINSPVSALLIAPIALWAGWAASSLGS